MYHLPIMVQEVLDGLCITPHGTYVDATLGGGGHSEVIAKQLKTGRLIAIDQDDDAILEATTKLKDFTQVTILKSNFAKLDEVLKTLNIQQVDGVLMDIGVSSHQLDDEERGFSYRQDAWLDMRMDRDQEISAWDVVNTYRESELEKIILEYGEERWAKRIAAFIVEARTTKSIDTTLKLDEIIKKAIPKQVRMNMKHPSKKVFQAIRIEVNKELDVLDRGLNIAFKYLKPGGRLAVITFHSLEDRMVKERFKHWQSDCLCPPESPICQCEKKKEGNIITRKPIVASKSEVQRNPRATSAKLRIIEKL